MKKLVSFILALCIVACIPVSAFADGNQTILTTTVPSATYTLNIPANQEIPFGTTSIDIGNVTVTDSHNFTTGKDLHVTVTYSEFTSEDVNTTIPFNLKLLGTPEDFCYKSLASGDVMIFKGKADTTVEDKSWVKIGNPFHTEKIRLYASEWAKALGGDYTATITFTAEVVVDTE